MIIAHAISMKVSFVTSPRGRLVAKSSFGLRDKADDLKIQLTMLVGAQPASGDIKRALYGRSTWSFQVDWQAPSAANQSARIRQFAMVS